MSNYESSLEQFTEDQRYYQESKKNMSVDRMMKQLESDDVNTRKLLEVIYDEFKK